MDPNFTFPRPQAPTPRQAAAQKAGGTSPSAPRESNGLRASVLDAALQLGLGSNPLVAGWMFDNSLPEEDEEPISSPGLTYGSSATSEESSSFALSPSSSAHSSASSSKLNPYGAGAQIPADSLIRKDTTIVIVEPSIDRAHDQSINGNGVPFPELPPGRPTTPIGGKKLKKKSRGDGYESDGGYMSEFGKKKDKKKKESKDKDTVETEKEAKKRAKEEKKEQELERKRTKSLASAAKAAKKAESKEAQNGYDTDGGGISASKSLARFKSKKAKSSATGDSTAGYETDGYQSSTPKKSKSRFFKLSSKGSKADAQAVEAVPPVPSLPQTDKDIVPLPIAERFATLLSSSSSIDSGTRTPVPLVPLPPTGLANPSSALPPLSFETFGSSNSNLPVSSSDPSLVSPSINRDSRASAASSSSNGSHSQKGPTRLVDSGHGMHGNGSGSYSTITSSSQQHQSDLTPDSTNPLSQSTPSKLSVDSSSGSGALMPPVMSIPNSRSPSPSRRPPPVPAPTTSPPLAPMQIFKSLRVKASLDNLHFPSRNASPMPITPISPFIMVPSNGEGSNPSSPISGAASPMRAARTPLPQSPAQSESQIFGRPRSVTEGAARSRSPAAQLSVPSRIISPPNTAMHAHGQGQRPAPLSINVSVEPPTSPTHLTSPNVLAYYAIPPPSPPPNAPLPHVPSHGSGATSPNTNANATLLPSPAALRQRIIDRTPRQLPPEFSAVFNGQANIQRGRESPFPARPIPVATGASLEPRGTMRRYRDLYSPTTSTGGLAPPSPQPDGSLAPTVRRTRFRSKTSFIENGYEYEYDEYEDENGSTELHDVLDRFEDTSSESVEEHSARALGRSQSSEALDESLTASRYYDAHPRVPRTSDDSDGIRTSEYHFDDGHTVGDRMSRWSGSIYSRASILDEDKSGETRDRLLKRVESMLKKDGRNYGDEASSGRDYVPPVPTLPDAYANSASAHSELTPGRSWNRF